MNKERKSGVGLIPHSPFHHQVDRLVMKFPLPADIFPQLSLSPSDIQTLQNIARDLVQERMTEFHEHLEVHKGHVDVKFWKKIKVREQISVYKATCIDSATQNANRNAAAMPMVLTVGTIQGNLDDVIYGAMTHSTHDMRIRTAYMGDKMCDGRQLASLVKPSRTDPLRSLTFQWRVKENPAFTPPPFVRLRDGVLMESTGFTHSPSGERFGYHLVHSVVLPGIHELHEYNIVRCNISLCFLYHQEADNVVGIYAKGILNSCGSIPPAVLALGAAETLVSLGRCVQCAELKKLAWVARITKPTDHRLQNPKACAVCTRKLRSIYSDDAKSHCSACRERICSHCTVKKKLASYQPHKVNELSMVKKTFCTRCVNRAKQISAIEVATYEAVETEYDVANLLVRDSASSISSLSTISDDPQLLMR